MGSYFQNRCRSCPRTAQLGKGPAKVGTWHRYVVVLYFSRYITFPPGFYIQSHVFSVFVPIRFLYTFISVLSNATCLLVLIMCSLPSGNMQFKDSDLQNEKKYGRFKNTKTADEAPWLANKLLLKSVGALIESGKLKVPYGWPAMLNYFHAEHKKGVSKMKVRKIFNTHMNIYKTHILQNNNHIHIFNTHIDTIFTR